MTDYLQHINESTLLQRIALGDELAFSQLFDLYRHKIYSYVLRFASPSIADEVVQDVFLKVWLQRSSLTEITNFPAWLHTVAKNRTYDALKQLAKEKLAYRELTETALQEQYSNIDARIQLKDGHQQLQRILQQLTPQQRTVFTLSRDQGLTYEQIAAHLQISRDTVKAHMVQALRIIRLRMGLNAAGIIVLATIAEQFPGQF